MTYQEFIQNIIDTRGQYGISDDEYYERHHIVPRCLGGDGDSANGRVFFKHSQHPNCIYLYPREHFEAHRLLALENPHNRDLIYAWTMMASINSNKREVTALEYEEAKEALSKKVSEHNHICRTGKQHPRARAIYCFESEEIYDTQREAGEALNISSPTHISSCCLGNRHEVEGYHFVYLDDFENMTQEEKDNFVQSCVQRKLENRLKSDKRRSEIYRREKSKMSKAVYAVELDKTFVNAREAEEVTGVGYKLISACCRRQKKSTYGHPDGHTRIHWVFQNEWDAMTDKEKDEYLYDLRYQRGRKVVCKDNGLIFDSLTNAGN